MKETPYLGQTGCPRGAAEGNRHIGGGAVLPFSRGEAWKGQSTESKGVEDEGRRRKEVCGSEYPCASLGPAQPSAGLRPPPTSQASRKASCVETGERDDMGGVGAASHQLLCQLAAGTFQSWMAVRRKV